MEPLMSAKEVARLLHISVNTVYRLKDQLGGLPAYRVSGRIRFKLDDVEAYLEKRTIEPVAPRQDRPGQVHFRYIPGMKVVS